MQYVRIALSTEILCLITDAAGFEQDNCTDGELRFSGVNRRSIREGRLEICINNAWGTVCDTLFAEDDAMVVCNQIGFSTEGWCLHKIHSICS